MSLFKNSVGRPSNDTLKRRKVFYSVIAVVVLIIISGGVYFVINGFSFSNIESTDMNANGKAITKVSLDKSVVQLAKGDKYNLDYTISPKNAKNKNITWTSSNTNVVSVSNSGRITAEKEGVATITLKTNNGKTDSVKVYVSSILITNKEQTIMDESTYKLSTKISNSTGDEKIYWETSNKKIAEVSSNGTITGKGKGTATITAYIKASNGDKIASDKYTIKVRAIKVILVGNSKTYKHSLATNFAKIARAEGYTIEGTTYNNYKENALAGFKKEDSTTNVTYFRDTGGRSLNWTSNIHKNELNNSYDYVVLQEQTDTYIDSDNSKYYNGALKVLDILYKNNNNIKMYIRKTWVMSNSNSKTIQKGYDNTKNIVSKLKKERNYSVTIINDGPSIYDAISQNISVMDSDKRHQNTNGGYLAASCIYSTLFNQDPTKISYKSPNMTSADATKLRKIAKQYCY